MSLPPIAPRTAPSASRYPEPTGIEPGDAFCSSCARNSLADRPGATAAISAATPVTCGAAIDVPESRP
jgi:hypothetical protein